MPPPKGIKPHPNSLAGGAATRFKPGQSANPGGRKKRAPLAHEYSKWLRKKLGDTKAGQVVMERFGVPAETTWASAIALGQVYLACSKTPAARELREPTEGKALNKIREVEPIAGLLANAGAQTEDELRRDIAAILARIRARRRDGSGVAADQGSSSTN